MEPKTYFYLSLSTRTRTPFAHLIHTLVILLDILPAKMATDAVDSTELRAAEQLDVEILPGTEVMKDVGDVHFAHAKGSDKGSV